MADVEMDFRCRVLLSVVRALVGEITPQMRFVGVEFSTEHIHLIVWNDGGLSESVKDDFDACAVPQIFADFCWPERGDPDVSFEFVRCDHPQKPNFRGQLVFGRAESNSH